jgi:hypothetical protein
MLTRREVKNRLKKNLGKGADDQNSR